MNKQGKIVNNKVVGGIEWTKWVEPSGNERRGFTWNVVGGCPHDCKWEMPNGDIAICYAKSVAERVAQRAYPSGFEHHYWHPDRLQEPERVKEPSGIFIDSMSDLMAHWVTDEQINQVIATMKTAYWHRYMLLTKNAPRLAKFCFPKQVWVGASSPPDFMFGKRLSRDQQERMLKKTLDVFATMKRDKRATITWLSIEPLSWDVSEIIDNNPAIDWAVIGAATNGRIAYQPDLVTLQNVLDVLAKHNIPVFYKGNLDNEICNANWREEFPDFAFDKPLT